LSDRRRVAVALSDSAHVHAALDPEEALVAPVGAPRVLDDPVVHAAGTVGAVADGKDGVVDVSSAVLAVRGGVHARGVVHEVVDNLESN